MATIEEKRALMLKYWDVMFRVIPNLKSTVLGGLTDAQLDQLFNLAKGPVKEKIDLIRAEIVLQESEFANKKSDLNSDSSNLD